MPGKITLQEIARAARVSVATASRVMNQTGRAGPETEQRVRAAAVALSSAQQRTERASTICFLLANRPMLHPFHAHVLMGAQALAAEHDTHILFYPFPYRAASPPDEIRLPLALDRRGTVDGFIVGGLNSGNLLELLTRIGAPFAVLGNNVLGTWKPELLDVVWMDDVTGAYEQTQYLQSLGHRSIWFLGGRKFPAARLEQGYCRAMQEAGLAPHTIESDSDDERDAGYLAAKSLFQTGQPVTAIFAHSDTVAHGVYEAAAACGRRIPDDVSIAGFGDRPECLALSPALTTVWGYPEQVGRRLAELVLNRIENRTAPPQRVELPMRLVMRNSCARLLELTWSQEAMHAQNTQS